MREVGIDLHAKVPALLTMELSKWADIVVTMGCGDACPVIPGKRYIDWELPDPKDLPLEEVRVIRDDIDRRVRDLVRSLD
jgi:arsenate reductase